MPLAGEQPTEPEERVDARCAEEEWDGLEIEGGYSTHYNCPHRYWDYYKYEDRDTDAAWPGKIENSFMEELWR